MNSKYREYKVDDSVSIFIENINNSNIVYDSNGNWQGESLNGKQLFEYNYLGIEPGERKPSEYFIKDGIKYHGTLMCKHFEKKYQCDKCNKK